jgi:hypothetical protein
LRAVLLVLAGLVSVALVPSAALAQSAPMCPLVPDDDPATYAYQRELSPLITPGAATDSDQPEYPGGGAQGAAQEALGAQFVMLWLDTPRQGWTVAFAPGALDATSARAAIRQALQSRFDAAKLGYLDQRLTVLPTPYRIDELKPVQDQVAAIAQTDGAGFISGAGITCLSSDAVRVEVTLVPKETPETAARAQALFDRFGDLVRVRYGVPIPVAGVGTTPPSTVPGTVIRGDGGNLDTPESAINAPRGTPTSTTRQSGTSGRNGTKLRVGAYAKWPKTSRCVRGRSIGIKAAKSETLKSIAIKAGKRTVTAKPGRTARFALRSRTTKLTVKVTLRDGRTATQTVTFKRCG